MFFNTFDWLGAKILLNTGELDGSVPCAELAQLASTHQGAAAGQSAPTSVCGTYSWLALIKEPLLVRVRLLQSVVRMAGWHWSRSRCWSECAYSSLWYVQLAGTHKGAAAGQSAPTPVCGTYGWLALIKEPLLVRVRLLQSVVRIAGWHS